MIKSRKVENELNYWKKQNEKQRGEKDRAC
jgi:hypothetical protein